jgi:tRNA-2-methylthio-N6-dimethylallyladenosine synthase
MVTDAAPYHLLADATSEPGGYSLRRTIAGDAWDRAEAESCGVPAPGTSTGTAKISLGLPTVRAK